MGSSLISKCSPRREFKGQQNREPLRGKSASERVSVFRGSSEVFRGFQRFSDVFRHFQRLSEIFQRFSEVLSETLSEADFPQKEALSPVPPDRVAP